jgi:hypothetical protein
MAGVECIKYREHVSGALQGFADYRCDKPGHILLGCPVFSKGDKRWVTLPSREYIDPKSGEKKYLNCIEFIDKSHNSIFSQLALQSLDEWCAKNAPSVENEAALGTEQRSEEELPF